MMPKPPNGNRVLDSGVSEVTSSGASDLHSSRSDNVWPIVSQSRGCPQGHWAAKCFPRGPQSDEEVRGREQQEGGGSFDQKEGRKRKRTGGAREERNYDEEGRGGRGRTNEGGGGGCKSVCSCTWSCSCSCCISSSKSNSNECSTGGGIGNNACYSQSCSRSSGGHRGGGGGAERISNKNKNTKPSCCLTGSPFGETSGANLLVDRSKNSVARASRETVGRESLS